MNCTIWIIFVFACFCAAPSSGLHVTQPAPTMQKIDDRMYIDRAESGPMMNSTDLMAFLMQSVSMFRKEQIPFTLFHGTALHLYRKDTAFIDDDVDFLIPAEHFHRVKRLLVANGLEVVYETSYFMRTGSVDIYKDSGDPEYVCERQSLLGYPRSMIEPYFTIDNSMTGPITVPSKTQDFLVANYGEGWRVPQDKKPNSISIARLHWNKNCKQYHRHAERNQACNSVWHGLNRWCPGK